MIKKLQVGTLFGQLRSTLNSMANAFKTLIKQGVFYNFIGILLIGLLIASCGGSKSLAKKGNQLQQAGLYADAADFFYNSLRKNNKNVDARIGLSSAGQQVLNEMLSEFSKANALGDHRKAVYSYLDAMAYRHKIQRIGVSLTAPDYFSDDFHQSKSAYVKTLYDRGNDLMADKNFDEANAVFSELTRLEPHYKDVKELKSVSQNEPIYLAGTSWFDRNEYRKAYYEFDAVYKADPNYKDVAILRNECLDKGQYPVAIVPFENATRMRGVEKSLQAFVLTDLSSIHDPFLKIIERDNLDVILREQRMNLSGMVNEQTAAEVGNLLGAKAILTGTVLSYSAKPGKIGSLEKDAYESYQVKLYNKEEDRNYYETRYKPIKYTEYFNINEVSISFQYKAISLETGEVLFSKVVNREMDSHMYYGAYPGEITNLYPAGKDGVITSNRERQDLMALMRAPRDIKSVDQLAREMYTQVANALTRDLINQINKL